MFFFFDILRATSAETLQHTFYVQTSFFNHFELCKIMYEVAKSKENSHTREKYGPKGEKLTAIFSPPFAIALSLCRIITWILE